MHFSPNICCRGKQYHTKIEAANERMEKKLKCHSTDPIAGRFLPPWPQNNNNSFYT